MKKMFNGAISIIAKHGYDIVSGALIALLLITVLSIPPMLTRFSVSSKPNPILLNTVMITNMEKDSGGSGVIIEHTNSYSRILTNAHVCKVVENGGLIKTHNGQESLVVSYKVSNVHDICEITVNQDLQHAAKLASKAPAMLSKATVAGHPSLLPSVITTGHFSERLIIQIMIGMEPCSDEDVKTPGLVDQCLFFGGFPLIKQFDALLATALIMPGSSGSGIYNDDGELAGLVFAGSAGLSYALTVPFEYVYNFVNFEQVTPIRVNYAKTMKPKQRKYSINNLKEKCKVPTNETISQICKSIY